MTVRNETALEWWQRVPKDLPDPTWDYTTGIAYLDAAWKLGPQRKSPPILVLQGDMGKTWTLRSLAARWVLAHPTANVVVLDSDWNWVGPTAAQCLQEMTETSCLQRIHVVAETEWIPVLECLPEASLLLWDGFPSDTLRPLARLLHQYPQMALVLALPQTTTAPNLESNWSAAWSTTDRSVPRTIHRIQLQRRIDSHGIATLLTDSRSFPFSISTGGILS